MKNKIKAATLFVVCFAALTGCASSRVIMRDCRAIGQDFYECKKP